jgi:two-component system chemotaxis response regulator CheB
MSEPIRVLVVDDSALMRKLIPQILEREASIKVVGTAMDGEFALKKIEELKPQVVTLDLDMPRMDGMETLRQITRRHHVPVIILSALSTKGANATFKALALGALDFVTKPSAEGTKTRLLQQIAADLIGKIKVAAQSNAGKSLRPVSALHAEAAPVRKPAARRKEAASKVVAIGVSTGGPNALQYLLAQLPGDFPGAIVVVQHMPEGFTEMFARRLDESSALEVKEARSGDLLTAGRVLVCPGNRHMKVRRMPLGDVVVLSDEEKVNSHRPSVDVLFRSVAQEFGPGAIAVLMTGMGDDGAEGMAEVKAAGGLTIAQDEDSSVVYGMPKAAIERGHASRVVSLEALANTLQAQCLRERRASEV